MCGRGLGDCEEEVEPGEHLNLPLVWRCGELEGDCVLGDLQWCCGDAVPSWCEVEEVSEGAVLLGRGCVGLGLVVGLVDARQRRAGASGEAELELVIGERLDAERRKMVERYLSYLFCAS